MGDSSPSSGPSKSIEDGSDDSLVPHREDKRFIRASDGRPVVITKPPLARFDSVDIDAPQAPARESHRRKMQNRDPNAVSHFAVRDESVPRPPDDPPSEKRAGGGTAAGHHNSNEAQQDKELRKPARQQSSTDKWWTFTSGTQFRKRVEDYRRHGEDAEKGDPEKQEGREKPHSRMHIRLDSLRGHHEHLSLNATQTPGWNSPWMPHRSDYIDDPRLRGPSEGPNTSMAGSRRAKVKGFFNSIGDFLVHSVWAPLFLRFLNIGFTTALVALASKIQQVEDANGIQGIIGESTIFALVIGPMGLIHVFVAIYLEYFGPPIGIWRMRTKMMHTLTELLFISLWAALLSLAFDDLFTTQATCTSWTPNSRWRPMFGDSSINGTATDRLCDLQGALVAMVFVGMILYQAVLVISLFRIFQKVSRK